MTFTMKTLTPGSDCVVCYVADANFLFPTIGSALSFRSFVNQNIADVIIFLLAPPGPNFDQVREELGKKGIKIVSLNDDIFNDIDLTQWNHTHISLAALGRFVIADFIARTYRKMLYVDGDTLFVQDPTPLLAFDPGEGKIAAVDDIRSFARHDIGRFGTFTRAYFDDLGIGRRQGYFNSGMLLVRARTWETMAGDALSFFRENVGICKFHDQSAINAVAGKHRVVLPLAWNFQTPYKFLGLESKIQPKILHFTEANKPWLGPLSPWSQHFDYYAGVEAQIGHLLPRPEMSDENISAQNKRTKRLLAKMHILFVARVMAKRQRIMKYERDALREFSLQKNDRATAQSESDTVY